MAIALKEILQYSGPSIIKTGHKGHVTMQKNINSLMFYEKEEQRSNAQMYKWETDS